jgi:hypothetical protein
MIASLEEYRAKEQKLKELLASFSSAGDLMDQGKLSTDSGNWQGVAERLSELKNELSEYRNSHPDEFRT